MFEIEIQGPTRFRLRVGRWHFRTWRSFVMKLPRGYRPPELVFSVESGHDTGREIVTHGCFSSEKEANRQIARLEQQGVADIYLNLVWVYSRVQDWEFDR